MGKESAAKGCRLAADLTPDEVEKLAASLHERMEHLDPTFEDDWTRLSEHRKEFYRLCVEWIVARYNALPTTTQ